MSALLDFRILDLVDILLVSFLLYQLYRLIRGTVAINVLIGVAAIYAIWKLVQVLQMELLSEILGQFIGVGVIALVIVFQQEIRRFLLIIGSTNFTRRRRFLKQLRWLRTTESELDIDELTEALENMAATKTGALIVVERKSKLGFYAETGTVINGELTGRLLEALFMKNAPLHDGAVILRSNKIIAAACILPVTENTEVPSRFGLRHRAALGISEKTDAVAIIVSEETGDISIAIAGELRNRLDAEQVKKMLNKWMEDV